MPLLCLRSAGLYCCCSQIRHMFEWETEDGAVPQVWRTVATKVPWIREMINRDRRLVPSAPRHCMWRCTARLGRRKHKK